MKRRSRLTASTKGFTLIEVLVVIILIGIVFAIASPGWDAFLSRQRVSTGREQVLQVIRQAQSEARNTRSYRVVVFDPNPPSGVPRVGSAPFSPTSAFPIPVASVNKWQSLGDGTVQRGVLTMRTNNTNNQLVFDADGNVAQPPIVANQFRDLPNGGGQGLAVTVARAGATNNATNRCVILNTLLGATRLAERENCP